MRIEKALDPGDVLRINTETLEVELNGSPVSGFLAGRIFDLSGGSNTIEYTDEESGRTIEIEVIYQPREL